MPPFGMYVVMASRIAVPGVPVHSSPIAKRSHTSQNDAPPAVFICVVTHFDFSFWPLCTGRLLSTSTSSLVIVIEPDHKIRHLEGCPG